MFCVCFHSVSLCMSPLLSIQYTMYNSAILHSIIISDFFGESYIVSILIICKAPVIIPVSELVFEEFVMIQLYYEENVQIIGMRNCLKPYVMLLNVVYNKKDKFKVSLCKTSTIRILLNEQTHITIIPRLVIFIR